MTGGDVSFKETPAYDAAVEAFGSDPTQKEPGTKLTKRQRHDANKRAQQITDKVWKELSK